MVIVDAAVIRARRGHVGHALDAVDLLLERRRHRVGDDLRARAGIVRAHHDLRRRDVRKLRDRQQEIADRARQHHDDGDGRGEDRPADEEADHQRVPVLRVAPSAPASARRSRSPAPARPQAGGQDAVRAGRATRRRAPGVRASGAMQGRPSRSGAWPGPRLSAAHERPGSAGRRKLVEGEFARLAMARSCCRTGPSARRPVWRPAPSDDAARA